MGFPTSPNSDKEHLQTAAKVEEEEPFCPEKEKKWSNSDQSSMFTSSLASFARFKRSLSNGRPFYADVAPRNDPLSGRGLDPDLRHP